MSDPVCSTPETASGSPGAVLRRCREFHGVTLEDASETTKIGVSYLRSLENDQIHEFANQAYLRGFLRIYATYLGLNFDDMAPMYDKLSGVQVDKPDRVHPSSASPRPPRRFKLLKKMLFPFLLLTVILITATFFKRPPSPPVIQPQPAPVVAPLREEAAVQQIQSSVRVRKVEKSVPPPKSEVISAVPSEAEKSVTVHQRPEEVPNGFILKIRATQNGTLTSNVDDSGPQKYELASGDVIEWKAEKSVTLELSNAGGVDVELNGKPYKPLGPPGKPAYVELDASGVKE
ncbi:MAG: helix-turn-helix domain-containing protein [Desulfuromonadaceae bacterium]